jgi:hypothetical protein
MTGMAVQPDLSHEARCGVCYEHANHGQRSAALIGRVANGTPGVDLAD